MSTFITGISELRTVSELGTIKDAAMLIDDGVVTWVGPANEAPAEAAEAEEAVDVERRAVLPGWVDSHSHMVFDGNRAEEFEARMAGEGYAAGGIAVTMEATRSAGEERLDKLVAERIAAAQALAAVFLISNMVQLAAYNRREQIGIMRMVGASRWFTQAPFVLEAVLSVLIGAGLAAIGVWAGKQLIVDPLLGDLYANQLIARVPDSTVWAVMPLVGLVAMVLGGLAAQVALRSYVRK